MIFVVLFLLPELGEQVTFGSSRGTHVGRGRKQRERETSALQMQIWKTKGRKSPSVREGSKEPKMPLLFGLPGYGPVLSTTKILCTQKRKENK